MLSVAAYLTFWSGAAASFVFCILTRYIKAWYMLFNIINRDLTVVVISRTLIWMCLILLVFGLPGTYWSQYLIIDCHHLQMVCMNIICVICSTNERNCSQWTACDNLSNWAIGSSYYWSSTAMHTTSITECRADWHVIIITFNNDTTWNITRHCHPVVVICCSNHLVFILLVLILLLIFYCILLLILHCILL